MTLTPLDQHDPRLRQVCAELSRAVLRDRQQQLEIDALMDFVYGRVNKTTGGSRRDPSRPTTVGLAGNQVGIMKQVCAVDLSVGHQGYSDMYILINPRITWSSKAMVKKPEGCVNFPEIWGVTHRARAVKVAALDRSGNELEFKLEGWPAVLAQHEIDHLYGRLFIDRLEDPHHAHHVPPEKYSLYRKIKPANWAEYIDVSMEAVPLPDLYQPGKP
ncbi:MAG TPA: peptide deformylase [Candidatus Saccharimonadia bacterium]